MPLRAEVYWITTGIDRRLAIMPRPRAGDWLADEVTSWRQEGLDVVVSLLQPAEISELGLAEEADTCRAAGLVFISFPIPDRGVPLSGKELAELITELVAHLREGRRIGIHCRIGVGRSALVAACLLACEGVGISQAFATIGRCRGLTVPDTQEQVRWVEEWVKQFGGKEKGHA
jgi:protein-tyrosine phosphatase